MNTKEPHLNFRLNGISFNNEELKEVGYSLIKEGEPFERSLGDFLLDWLNDEPEIQVKTSGSTGAPKVISLQKAHMVNSAKATGAIFNLHPGQSALLCLPTEYIAGKMMLVRAMVLGLKLDYVEPSSRPLDFVSKHYDFCAMVPLQLETSPNKLNKIKTLIVGGAPISDDLKSRIQGLRCRVFETYGMTETCTHIAIKKLNHSPETTFKIVPDVSITTDKRDCLVIDAPLIIDQKITTNDVVHLVSESEFEWLGRADHVINSGGVKLASILKHRFFVAGLPDKQLGEKPVLVIEAETEEKGLFDSHDYRSLLEKFETPKKIILVSKFMESGSGKIKRKETLESIKN